MRQQSGLVTSSNRRNKPPKSVQRIPQKDQRGNVIGVRYYHRKGDRIHGDLNSDKFLEIYLRLQKGVGPKTDDSLHSLVTEYLSSPEYEKLAKSSRVKYRLALDAARERWDWVKISDLEEDDVVQEIYDWRDSMRKTPSKANSYLRVLKSIFFWAQKRRKIKINPAHCRYSGNH